MPASPYTSGRFGAVAADERAFCILQELILRVAMGAHTDFIFDTASRISVVVRIKRTTESLRFPMSEFRSLLLTDVVDSTKLAESIGDEAMAEVWISHDRVARDLLPKFRGREIDKTDGMLMLFDGAADAVAYALAYHRALAELPVPLKARAGVHVGAVTLRENSAADIALGAKPIEVEGLAKPTAARVMSLARGGQILLTTEAREDLGKTEIKVISHGHWMVKGVADPIELFEVGEAQTRFIPPFDSEKVFRVVQMGEWWLPVRDIPHNLPHQGTSFVGREQELDEVKEFLGKSRLVTLVGMGGLGKTRLCIQAAAELIHQFPDGVWFLDLAPLHDPALVVGEAAQVMGVNEEPGRTRLQAICAHMKARRALIILDNCEHLVQASAEFAAAVLRSAPNVRMLASSREALHVPGEQSYPIRPLPLPAQDAGFNETSASTAVRLFVERARQHKPSFALEEAQAPMVAELVSRLDGIPLAIELAAARIKVLSIAEINGRLKDRFKLLTGGARVLQERQQTLRALVDWSYDLLNAQEQTLLVRLAVFVGGFDLEAAETVCAADPVSAEEVLDLLASLVEKSLVMFDDSAKARATGCWRRFATMRARSWSRAATGPRAPCPLRPLLRAGQAGELRHAGAGTGRVDSKDRSGPRQCTGSDLAGARGRGGSLHRREGRRRDAILLDTAGVCVGRATHHQISADLVHDKGVRLSPTRGHSMSARHWRKVKVITQKRWNCWSAA